MEAVLAFGIGVILIAATVMLCLLGRPSLAKAFIALIAGCLVGAAYFIALDLIDSGYPNDPRYYSMALPRFAFQGFVAGGIVSLGVVFVATLWRLIRLANKSAVESSGLIERKP